MNGVSIPFKELGFASIYHLLDDLSDTIDAYQTPNGQVFIFPKSSESTRHIESLVARQRKTQRVGRLGGIVHKAPEECHGTPERRQYITDRVLKLFETLPQSTFIKYNDVLDAYERMYGEKLDARDDFYCTTKALFEIKLSNYFDIRDSPGRGGGGFSVKFKENVVVQQKPSTPVGQRQQTLPPIQQPQMKKETMPIPVAAQSPPPISMKESIPKHDFPPAPIGIVTRALNDIKSQPSPPISMIGPIGGRSIRASVSPATRASIDDVLLQPLANILRSSSPATTPVSHMVVETKQPPPVQRSIAVAIPAIEPIPATIDDQQQRIARIRSLSTGSVMMNRQPPPMPIPMLAPPPRNLPKISMYFQDKLRRLLMKYPRGVELSVFEWSYQTKFNESIFAGYCKDQGKSLIDLLRDYPNVCEIIQKEKDRYLIKPKSTPMVIAYVAPKSSPIVAASHQLSIDRSSSSTRISKMIHDKESSSLWNTGLLAKLRPDADLRGTTCHRIDRTRVSAN